MEIRDPVHGSIHIKDEEIPIITSNFFQRLRTIKQLGFSEYVYPGATHNRYLHSIGVMSIGTRVFDRLFTPILEKNSGQRLKKTFKLACLLHDIGHAPLSHATESAMPTISELKLANKYKSLPSDLNRQANHEDYTVKAIVDSSLTEKFAMSSDATGVGPHAIADLITGNTDNLEYFTIDGINYFPILHQLISSEMDCDRMDYLLRDSYFCGVSYGDFDLDWMIDNLRVCVIKNDAFLGISERAVVTFDDFLLSRFHMFLQVYFHYRSVCLEQLLLKYFASAPTEYKIPADIEQYIEHDDHFLMKVLRKSNNKYAQAIVANNIPQKIYESFSEKQLAQLEIIQKYLEQQGVEYIRCSTSGRLSKYQGETENSHKYSIHVARDLYGNDKSLFIEINQATDLFNKFSKAHAVNRLHCDYNALSNEIKRDIINLIK